MNELLAVAVLLGLPAAVVAIVLARTAVKRRLVEGYLERLKARLAGAEWLPDGCFRWKGRVHRLEVGINPLFEARLSLRLAAFCPSTLEAEIRDARNVPTKTPQKLADDPFYRRFVLDSPSADDAVEYFLSVRDEVAALLPLRWGSVSRRPGEVALSGNRSSFEDLEADLELLGRLAAKPADRKPRGGTWTIREGFERHVPLWHWKPVQRELLAAGVRRWCVSLWCDNALLNRPILSLLWRLAGDRPRRFLTAEKGLAFLEHAWGRPVPLRGHLVDLDLPDMAVAADQRLDGDFFDGFLAGEVDGHFDGAIRFHFHDLALAALPKVRVYVRRLYDDEFSWFSGEYEILSMELSDDDVRGALTALASEHGAQVQEIDRPFSFKLLKEDRLEWS